LIIDINRQADGCLLPRLSLNLQQTAISLALITKPLKMVISYKLYLQRFYKIKDKKNEGI